MICLLDGSEYRVEKYSAYKNRTVAKFEKRVEDTLTGIRQCSLNEKDKNLLRLKLINKINESLK